MRTRPSAAQPALLKRLNTGRIVARILEGGAISRAELARQAEISAATVSVLIADLIEQGIVVEVGPGDSVRGRKPTLIQLNPDGAAIVVASIRPTHFIVGVSDLTSHLRHVHEESYPPEAPPESVVPILSDALAALVAQTSAEGRPVLGVGVSTVGIIRPTDASVIQSPNQPRWREVHLGEMLRERLGQAVYVANDARTLALAEMIYGGGRKYRHMVCLSVTEGIGAGVVIDGHICWGKNGNAGELGHTVVDPDGRMCGCGKRGCLEAMASERALLATVRARLHRGATPGGLSDDGLSVEAILEAMELDDPTALAAAQEVGYYLGVGMANAVNTFDPEGLALYGRLCSCEPIMRAAREVLEQQALPASLESLDIWVSSMGEEAMLKGAAAQVLSRRLLAPRL